MTCPECGNEKTTVVETRRVELGELQCPHRRRKCGCGHSWWTVEIPKDWIDVLGEE